MTLKKAVRDAEGTSQLNRVWESMRRRCGVRTAFARERSDTVVLAGDNGRTIFPEEIAGHSLMK